MEMVLLEPALAGHGEQEHGKTESPGKNEWQGRAAGSPGTARKVEIEEEATTEFPSCALWISLSFQLAETKRNSFSPRSVISLLWLLPSVEAFASAHVMDASGTGKLSSGEEKEKKICIFLCFLEQSSV